jgi:hypothetical protein
MIELSSMLGCETDLPSPHLSPAQIIFVLFLINRLQDAGFTGERGGNRTYDPLIKSKTPEPQQHARSGQLSGSA